MELKWKSCLRAGVTVMVLYLMIHYWIAFTSVAGIALGAAMPLFLGCIIAYIVNIPMSFIEKGLRKFDRGSRSGQEEQEAPGSQQAGKPESQNVRSNSQSPEVKGEQRGKETKNSKTQKRLLKNGIFAMQRLRRPVSLVLALISIVLVVFLVIRMIVPELLSCMQLLFRELPGILQDSMQWLEDNLQISTWLEGENGLLAMDMDNMGDWQEWVTKLSSFLWSDDHGCRDRIVCLFYDGHGGGRIHFCPLSAGGEGEDRRADDAFAPEISAG